MTRPSKHSPTGPTRHPQPMPFAVLLCLFCCLLAQKALSQPFSDRYPHEKLTTLMPLPGAYAPMPSGTAWRDSLPVAMRQDYVALGRQHKGKPWEPIAAKTFAEYRTTGNARNYESLWEERRRQLARLALAEVMEQRQQFIPDIRQGLHYFMETTWWGVPAHYPTAQPDRDNQVVDLISAEVANLLAWTVYLLRTPLEAAEPGLCDRVRADIDRRLLTPARTTAFDWKRRTSNWNPWICANWLSCVLLCETDRERQLDAIAQILRCMDVFYNAYPDDGGCDEGISYWYHGAASLFECLQILHTATNGEIDYGSDKKLKAMAAFPYKSYIANRQSVNYADAYVSTSLQINIAYPFGRYVGDPSLTAYAAYQGQLLRYNQTPARHFDGGLSRELMFLKDYGAFRRQQPAEPLLRDTWLPDMQTMTARQASGTANGLFLAAKGGHNGESHNHNDVGNFIVYNNGKPLLIDLGSATYTAQTFGKDRYKLTNTRSAYHNLPLINGTEQREGQQYRGKGVKYKQGGKRATFTIDIAGAYPAEAAVRKWVRTVTYNRGKDILVTEDYQLERYVQPTEIILVCPGTATADGSTVTIGSGTDACRIRFDSRQLSATVEPLAIDDPAIANSWKTKVFSRIRLTVQGQATKGKLTYTIVPAQTL